MQPETDYTAEQIDGFKREWARRRRRQTVVAIVVVAMMVLAWSVGQSEEGIPSLGIPPGAAMVVFWVTLVGGVVFAIANWRCPGCGAYVSRQIDKKFCPNCGAPLE